MIIIRPTPTGHHTTGTARPLVDTPDDSGLFFLSLLMAPVTLSVPSCTPILMPLAERTVAYLADVRPCARWMFGVQ